MLIAFYKSPLPQAPPLLCAYHRPHGPGGSQLCALSLCRNTHSSPPEQPHRVSSATASPSPSPPAVTRRPTARFYVPCARGAPKGARPKARGAGRGPGSWWRGAEGGSALAHPAAPGPASLLATHCSPLPAAAWPPSHWVGFLPGLRDDVWSLSAGEKPELMLFCSQARTSSNAVFPRSACG